LVERLLAQGLLDRRPSPSDRREQWHVPTRTGSPRFLPGSVRATSTT
jgi:DNA-binding MarR family transcriptional regulator